MWTTDYMSVMSAQQCCNFVYILHNGDSKKLCTALA